MIKEQLKHIQDRIDKACLRSGRSTNEVRLLLATKTVNAENISLAIRQGYPLIAENRIQEVKEKYEALRLVPHENHFIGHLQTNKIKELLKYEVTCLHSLDRLELAEKLNRRLASEGKRLDVLVQVNTSSEESKFGIAPEKTLEFIHQLNQFKALTIKGLMTIGLFSASEELIRPCFQLLRTLRDRVNESGSYHQPITELSMGMSGDLEIAIEEGATIVRVGTAIFGQRALPDSYYWQENKG